MVNDKTTACDRKQCLKIKRITKRIIVSAKKIAYHPCTKRNLKKSVGRTGKVCVI